MQYQSFKSIYDDHGMVTMQGLTEKYLLKAHTADLHEFIDLQL